MWRPPPSGTPPSTGHASPGDEAVTDDELLKWAKAFRNAGVHKPGEAVERLITEKRAAEARAVAAEADADRLADLLRFHIPNRVAEAVATGGLSLIRSVADMDRDTIAAHRAAVAARPKEAEE